MVIDAHAHVIPVELIDYLKSHPELGVAVDEGTDQRIRLVHKEGYRYPVGPEFISLEPYLGEMDKVGVDHRIVSISPTLFLYKLPGTQGADLARSVNGALVGMAKASGGRLTAMLTVPLQEPGLAAEEIKYWAKEPIVKGVEIGTNVEATELDDPGLEVFYEAAENAGYPLFLHPYYVGPKHRLEEYYLTNSLGNPLDTTIAVSRLVHGGVLERHPKLKVLLAHGGGFFPYQKGRLEHAFNVRREPKAACEKPPSSFLSQIYYDTILHSGEALRYLIDTAGADHVMIGSDYPFDMGPKNPAAILDDAGLSEQEREAVSEGTVKTLYGL